MGFIYTDITGKDVDSGQYEVSFGEIYLGSVIKNGSSWLVARPGSTKYEDRKFSDKTDAAKCLAELAGINWQS